MDGDPSGASSSLPPTDCVASMDNTKKDGILADERSVRNGENNLLSGETADEGLALKMSLVNDTIEEIGFTAYQWKLFCLNGFGYAVDSLVLLIQSITAPQAGLEFEPSYPTGMTIAVYVGMLAGALFWGFSADIIGRRFAFNFSLLISSVFTIVAGFSPNWTVLGLFISLSAFGAGGNLVLDTTVFLEYLPGKDQWLLTLMAAWWGVGQLIAGLFAWGFLPKYSCSVAATCLYENNKGWRYVWFTSGVFVFLLSILRLTVIRLEETPKFLVSEGRDEQVVRILHKIAGMYNRPCSLTLEQLQRLGPISRLKSTTTSNQKIMNTLGLGELIFHMRGLFASHKLSVSTALVWFSWLLIGLAYPLYNVFLPEYLKSRGAHFGATSPYITWRNYALNNLCSIPGPILAGLMCRSGYFWGRRGTMIIGALVTMVFCFCYTQVRTEAQNLGFTCAITFCLNIYYGTLYAYTPEVFPSAHRGTGNGIAIGLNRIMGILSAIVAQTADTSTPVPIYICAALYIVMAVVAAALPFEPYGRTSS